MLPFLLAPLVALPAAAAPTLDEHSVPAEGRGAVHARIDAFGRYALATKSRQGVALQVVDRADGPGPMFGRPGHQDGRIDTFLDRGTYRILTFGDSRAEGRATVAVHPFVEKNGPAPAKLVEHRLVTTTLEDFEQRSYWIEITERRTVVFEAAGRNLHDLRLWRDGTWLVDRAPNADVTEPAVGRPLTVNRLVAELEPGIYLLTAYGGTPREWANDDGTHPFHLRFGVREHPTALRQRAVIGPFGYDRFLVKEATYFRVELSEAQPLALAVERYDPRRPFASSGGWNAAITKKTVPPVAEVFTSGDGLLLVTVRGPAGRPYVLQHFERRRTASLPKGRYYLSTVHSGHPADTLDASGIIVREKKPFAATSWQTVTLSAEAGWARRFELMEPSTVFVDVKTAGTYRVQTRGDATARFVIEPFFVTPPKDYRSPSSKPAPSDWSLDAGLHVLTIRPEKKGIIEVAVANTDGLVNALSRWVGSSEAIALPRPGLRFESFESSGAREVLRVSQQPGVRTGIVVRSLPLDLRDPLFVAQRPKDTVTLEIEVAEEGVLQAITEDGSRIAMSVDDGPWTAAPRPSVGPHRLRIANETDEIVSYAVGLRVRSLEPDSPLPALPDPRSSALAAFEKLSDRADLDLDRNETRSYLVEAKDAGLYRLESTGLLATRGDLRTRVVPSLAAAAQNGVGRNFLLQRYLGVGTYQVTVRTEGRSKGHLGLRLKRTAAIDGGALVDGVPARATLAAGTTIVYRFEIEAAGRHRLRAFGQGRTFTGRLERYEPDSLVEGEPREAGWWPLVEPGGGVDIDRHFEAGSYRLVVLPQTVDARVVTTLERQRDPLVHEGHGPHPLPLDTVVEHEWIDEDLDDPAQVDAWDFDVPADVELTIALTGMMHGDLVRGSERVAYVPPARGWTGRVERGRYRLVLRNFRRTTRVPYSVAVRPAPMVVGARRTLEAPAEVALAIGADEVVEIESFGGDDVAGFVVGSDGRTIARSDDRTDDWNFAIARRLAPGRYTLHVVPVAARRATTEIRLRTREESTSPALKVPGRVRLTPGDGRQIVPLEIAKGARFLVAWARSTMTSALVLEEDVDGWRPVAQHVGRPARLEVPLPLDAMKRRYRLKVWSTEVRGAPIDLDVHGLAPQPVAEDALFDGLALRGTAELPVAIAAVALDRPGTFSFAEPKRIRWSGAASAVAEAPRRGLAHPAGRQLWIVADLDSKGRATVRAKRIAARDGALPLTLSAAPVHVDVEGDALVVAELRAAKARTGVAFTEEARFDLAADGRAVAVQLETGPTRARLWAAEPTADVFDATVKLRRFEPPAPTALDTTNNRGTVPAGAAVLLTTTRARARYQVILPEGGVAAVADGAKVDRVVVGSTWTERFEATADRIYVFNPTQAPLVYAIDVLPGTGAASLPYERLAATRQRTEVAVPPGADDRVVQLRGAEEALFFGSDGSITAMSEERLAVGSRGGSLRIVHGATAVMAWLDDPEQPLTGLFDRSPAPVAIEAPAVVRLDGAAAQLSLRADEPTLFEARIDAPVVAHWTSNDVPGQVTLGRRGASIPLYLGGGSGRLTLRRIGHGALDEPAELRRSTVPLLNEGVGPEAVIGPGSARAFRFVVPARRKIGVGLRSTDASVDLRLVREDGEVVGRGVAQLHVLDAGTYVLVAFAPPDGPTARVRPVVVGLAPPPTGPPNDVLERYLTAAGFQEER